MDQQAYDRLRETIEARLTEKEREIRAVPFPEYELSIGVFDVGAVVEIGYRNGEYKALCRGANMALQIFAEQYGLRHIEIHKKTLY